MNVKVLGSGNAFNQDERLNSAYLINSHNKNILVDCGFTVPYALQKLKFPFCDLDYIFITHYHGDHYAGLSALLLGLKYIYPLEKELTIVGPGDVRGKVLELLKVLYGGTEKILDELNLKFVSVDQNGGKYKEGDLCFESVLMKHSEKAEPVGYLLRLEGKNIGFSGDTCWHDGVEPFVHACDKVFLECNFADKVGEGHISVDELESSQVIQQLKSQIYLSHLYEGSALKANSLGYNILSDGDALNFKF
ncbi:MAG: ribonuclease BN (tRNA processing enzyme) [Flavobacteriales bacterium]|jgi:ribonuclease BN (tRNA processing enzyme)|tara:strand:+ start:13346 stop:14092 length:747 start_codon:yes stop_codon:yes gene_type:complete